MCNSTILTERHLRGLLALADGGESAANFSKHSVSLGCSLDATLAGVFSWNEVFLINNLYICFILELLVLDQVS